jgi:glycine cleavage system P protein (glycine dehydrogenase) subunit 1
MRYVPNTKNDQGEILSSIGKSTVNDLFSDVPNNVLLKKEINLPAALSEPELLEELKKISGKDLVANNFEGGGSYNHFIPSVIKHLVGRSEFYTAYTPYQAEASQGTLQAIFEYQTMICELTGMDVANASIYDGATALVEAAFLACRSQKKDEIAISAAVHPEYRKVLRTYAKGAGLKIVEIPYDKKSGLTNDPSTVCSENTACVIYQQPNFFGCIENIKKSDPLLIVSADPISLGILKAPGDYGADIVVGEGQSLGSPRSFGGPGLGIFAAKKKYMRMIPGRIVGQTTDRDGKTAYCLTLQTREQHIRREKAPSNICSNEALAALSATLYLSIMGKQGLRKVAELCLQKANYLKKQLKNKIAFSSPIFKEFVVKTEKNVGIPLNGLYPELKGHKLICVTELTSKKMMDNLIGQLT